MEYLLYAILGIIGIFLVLIIIAIINAIIIKDRKPREHKTVLDEKTKNKYAKDFAKMIQVKSISYRKELDNKEAFIELQAVMEKLFPNVHKTLEKTKFDGESMIFKWKGKSDERPIVLMAHQDVVPANQNGWDFGAFSGDVTKTEIRGRGTLDTKSTLYAFFQAVEELIKEKYVPEHDIYLASSSDEEVSGFGAEITVEWLKKKGVKPYLVLDEGGAIVLGSLPSASMPIALIGVIEKGYFNIKFTAKSRGGHSSTPPKNTPIARLAKFITHVENHFPLKTKMIKEVADIFKNAAPSMSFLYRFLFGNIWLFKGLLTYLLPKINPFGRALLSTTIAFTMQSGSEAENVIPSEAYVLCNLRTHPIQGVNESFEVLKKIAAKYDVEAEITEQREFTPIVDTKGEAYKYLVSQIEKVFPDVLVSPYVILGGTDCRFYTEISDSALRFSPVRMDNEELSKMHGKNESIRIDALAEAVVFYKELIKNHK